MHYRIEVTNKSTGKLVSRVSFDSNEQDAHDILSERADRHGFDDVMDLKHNGQTIARCRGSN